jgi:hypothetical protein
MENITIKNHLQELQVSTARMLVYNSDNAELLSYFKDVTFKLEMIEQLLNIDSLLDWNAIEGAYKSILNMDSELTNVEINLELKPAIEKKVGKITAKLY